MPQFLMPLRQFVPQPLIALVTCFVGATAILMTSGFGTGIRQGLGHHGLLIVILLIPVVAAQQFPIHIRLNTKVQMTTIPMFLIAAFLEPSLAALVGGGAMLAGELTVRKQKGNYPSDIATDVGRWSLAVLFGSAVIHGLSGQAGMIGSLALGGCTMWLWDMLSSPATLSPMSGEWPLSVVRACVREGGAAEGAQYVLGVAAAVIGHYNLWAISLLILPAAFVQIATKRSKELNEGTQHMLERLADTVDLRDLYTGGHSRRVTQLVDGILNALEKSGPEVPLIVTAARLHDIGKISVPDAILNKEGKLSDEEWAIMASHPEVGADFLGKHPGFRRGVEIVRHHHEAWNGSGYPHKLKGTDIPFGARVIAVADSFDAMTSDRPYRKGMTVTKAVSILREGRGVQWDPEIVDAFVRSIGDRLEMEGQTGLLLVHSDGRPVSQAATA
ncbi:MAG TPA: HD-GYP domain-containing protein [Chloroflexota bacterium]|nr:HD-GYP domain-containing protein [Chloroflexota bacterium]